MEGNRKRVSLWLDDDESPKPKLRRLNFSESQSSSELEVAAGISRTLPTESKNDFRDIIIIDSNSEEDDVILTGYTYPNRTCINISEVERRSARRSLKERGQMTNNPLTLTASAVMSADSLWLDDDESPRPKLRRFDILESQSSSVLEAAAGISRTLPTESNNDSQDIIIIDSYTEEDDVILTGYTYPNGTYIDISEVERRSGRRSLKERGQMTNTPLTSTASAVMSVDSTFSVINREEVGKVEDIEDEQDEAATIETEDQLADAEEFSSYEINGDVRAKLADDETVDDDEAVVIEAASNVYEEKTQSEDSDEGNVDIDVINEERENGNDEVAIDVNSEGETAAEEVEMEENAAMSHDNFDTEQEDFMYTFDVPEILWEAGFDLLEDFFQLDDPIDGEDFIDDPDSLQPDASNGLTQKEIDKFPMKTLKECNCSTESPDKCIICLNNFQGGDAVRTLKPCNHEFHQACIDEWLKSHKTCPLCRTYVDDWNAV